MGLGLESTRVVLKNRFGTDAVSWDGIPKGIVRFTLDVTLSEGTMTVKGDLDAEKFALASSPSEGLVKLERRVKFWAGTVKLNPGLVKAKLELNAENGVNVGVNTMERGVETVGEGGNETLGAKCWVVIAGLITMGWGVIMGWGDILGLGGGAAAAEKGIVNSAPKKRAASTRTTRGGRELISAV
jgi:hypothetical protein